MKDDPPLPPGFRFEPWGRDTRLQLNEATLAHATAVSNEPSAPWRICFRPDTLGHCYGFMNTEAGAKRLMAAFAWKRQDSLRQFAEAAEQRATARRMHPNNY